MPGRQPKKSALGQRRESERLRHIGEAPNPLLIDLGLRLRHYRGTYLTLQSLLAPFLAPNGGSVLLLLGRGSHLVTRVVIAPFYVRFPTDSPTPGKTFPSNYSGFKTYKPRLWRYGVHRAPWSSIIYARGTVWIAVNQQGRWVGECDAPPGNEYVRRTKLALSELLTSGDAVRAERIAQGPVELRGSVYDLAVPVLTVCPAHSTDL
jgi:hypothetical protein